MKRIFTAACLLMLLAMSVQVYAQATCGGPCGGFTSSATSVALNSNIVLTTSYTSGVTWSVSSGLSIVSSSAGSITVKGTVAGARTLCMSYNANGTVCSVCKVINVTDCPANSPAIGFIYDGGANPPVLKVTANIYSGSYSYTWYVNGVLYAGPSNGFNQIAIPNPQCGQVFEVSMSLTTPGGCTRSSGCKRVYFNCGTGQAVDDGPCQGLGNVERVAAPSLRDTKLKGILSVYPNPAWNTVNLTFEDASQRTLEVVDAAGNVVHSKVISEKEYTLDVSKFKKGEYYIRQRNAAGKESVNRLLIE